MAEAKSKEEMGLHQAELREAGRAWHRRAAGQGCGGAGVAVPGWAVPLATGSRTGGGGHGGSWAAGSRPWGLRSAPGQAIFRFLLASSSGP